MKEIIGKYNTAIVFTDNIEEVAISQIKELCDQEFVKDSKIRIMPDTHAGAGCTIGTTMTISDKIVSNLVGVDIGCGVETIKISQKNVDFEKVDNAIRDNIPSGFEIRNSIHKYSKEIDYKSLKCRKNVSVSRAQRSIGTLGGGNHFIEINRDSEGYLYVVVHSGSRYLGKQVADYYQNLAFEKLTDNKEEVKKVIEKLKKEGRQKEIQSEIKKVKKPEINKDLAYLEGEDFNNYINDMKIVQKFAVYNRKAIIDEIIDVMCFDIIEQFTTIHNYIDTDSMILRKGAISAKKGEKLLIPINMRDGSIICVGKGNEDWNFSAPHGAGRIMSRKKAKESLSIEDFMKSMDGIFTTSVGLNTLDESPDAYKNMDEIVENIKDTIDIVDIIKPVYNFKAS